MSVGTNSKFGLYKNSVGGEISGLFMNEGS